MNQLALCRIYTAKTNQSCLLPFPLYIYIYREREIIGIFTRTYLDFDAYSYG